MIYFSFLDSQTRRELFEMSLGSKFTISFFQQHKAQFKEQYYTFQVRTPAQKWLILKSEQQIKQIIDKIFFEYKISFERFEQQIDSAISAGGNNQTNAKGQIYQKIFNQIAKIAQKNERFQYFLAQPQHEAYRSFSMEKRSTQRGNGFCGKINNIFDNWKKRTVSIYTKGVAYRNTKGEVKSFILFGKGFSFAMNKGNIVLTYNQRKLQLKPQSARDFIQFLFTLHILIDSSPYTKINRYNSFAPVLKNNLCKFFVDGAQYFQAVAQSILRAQKTIYITGWMISPQFLLIRQKKLKVSLQNVLESASKRGVKISIIIYHESTFLNNDSLYAKTKLEGISSNIKICRHPNEFLPFLWTHHGKIIVIDEKQAFIGGLDLCYSRYDTSQHKLFDTDNTYPGVQYNNVRINDAFKVRDVNHMSISPSQCRMPWHDIAQYVFGPVVGDLVYHFTELWNFVHSNFDGFTHPPPHVKQVARKKNKIITSCKKFGKRSSFKHQISHSDHNIENLINQNQRIKINKKQTATNLMTQYYQQAYQKDQTQLMLAHRLTRTIIQPEFQNYLDAVKQQLQQKQIINKQIQRLSNSKIRLTRQERIKSIKMFESQISIIINQQKNQKNKKRSSVLAGNDKKEFIEIQLDKEYLQCLKKVKNSNKLQPNLITIKDFESQNEECFGLSKPIDFKGKIGEDQCQIVRSVGNWSFGHAPQNTECSIYIAYLQLIAQAKHYIYIQNQFFVSSTAGPLLKNQIAYCIFKRISKAVKNQQTFRVYILLPLLPGFAGDMLREPCILLRKQMEWVCDTVKGLLKQISTVTREPSKYIQFLSLRTHGQKESTSEPQTELIYIHAKLLIIDDEYVLCGSANLNDRSLLGNRDSQIAMVTKGGKAAKGLMDGEFVTVSSSVQNLRQKLFQEHFGLNKQMSFDPICRSTWSLIANRAKSNTHLYRMIFGSYPDDTIKKIKEISVVDSFKQIRKYNKIKDQIVGHVVEFPYMFLNDEKLVIDITNKEFFIPMETLV